MLTVMGATFFNLTGLLLKGRGTYIAEAGCGVKKTVRTATEEEGYRVLKRGIESKVLGIGME